MCIIRVGGEEFEFLAITLLGRSHPAASDYWDGNWSAPSSRSPPVGSAARSRATCCRSKSDAFRRELALLGESLAGIARFAHNGGVALDQRDRRRAWPHRRNDHARSAISPASVTLLRSGSALDQTYLRSLVAQLRQAMAKFPVHRRAGRLTSAPQRTPATGCAALRRRQARSVRGGVR